MVPVSGREHRGPWLGACGVGVLEQFIHGGCPLPHGTGERGPEFDVGIVAVDEGSQGPCRRVWILRRIVERECLRGVRKIPEARGCYCSVPVDEDLSIADEEVPWRQVVVADQVRSRRGNVCDPD